MVNLRQIFAISVLCMVIKPVQCWSEGSSTYSATSPDDSTIRMGVTFRLGGAVNDFRNLPSSSDAPLSDISGALDNPANGSRTDEKIKVNQSYVYMSSALSHDPSNAFSMGMGLNISSVHSDDEGRIQETEFDSFKVYFEGKSKPFLAYQFGVNVLRSPKNYLYEAHNEVFAGVYFTASDKHSGGIENGLKVGPEFSLPINNDDAKSNYAVQWGGLASIWASFDLGQQGVIRADVDGFFRRTNSYAVEGVGQGGGGLLALRPKVDYLIMDDMNLWIGIFIERAVFRPDSKESVFGNLSLPGLFGTTVGLTLSMAAL